ncbi:FAD dependent oxidoreductase [Colletotrichum sojae]|uniref:FAD dependent oxidoreductase n=1 Tax=Colletotrichum sojae TaxID=2175907 RepID=A0A8H6MJE5_9PEZI|nr:FAD dependent oxidoreductase [Colletotrichum sojae]
MSATSSMRHSDRHFETTSGATDAVWVHDDPYANRAGSNVKPLDIDIEADVCIVGSGIARVSVAYELVTRGKQVVLLEAREFLSGETVGRKLGVDCEYRKLPGYTISQYVPSHPKHSDYLKEIKEEVLVSQELGVNVEFKEGLQVKGWSSASGGLGEFGPAWRGGLARSSNLSPHEILVSVDEPGVGMVGFGNKHVEVKTQHGNTVVCDHAVEATNVPLQKLSIVAEMDDSDYIILGGLDHKVGQEDAGGRFEELETWVRERFPQATTVDYRWSGQIFEPVDYMAFIGLNQGCKRTYIVTGDSGNGLTHGVIAGKLIADEIHGEKNSWAGLYSPKRKMSILGSAVQMIAHDLQINFQYKRLLQSDITDIEDLAPGCGGVLNPATSKPVAVFKDENGKMSKMSALCPHMKGVRGLQKGNFGPE